MATNIFKKIKCGMKLLFFKLSQKALLHRTISLLQHIPCFFFTLSFFFGLDSFSFHTKSETVWGPPFEREVWTFNKKKFDLHILSFLGSFSGAQQSEIKSKHVSSSSRLSYCCCSMRTWHQLLEIVVRAPTCGRWLRKIRHGFPFI